MICDKIRSAIPWLRKKDSDYAACRRFRIDVVNENAFMSVWSIRLSRGKLAGCIAGVVIVICVMWTLLLSYTPLRVIMPSRIEGQMRDNYVDISLKIDSIADVAAMNDRYIGNLLTVLGGEDETVADDGQLVEEISEVRVIPVDSLMSASDTERWFMRQFEDAERLNLSVLSPIAAEGMTFYSPFPRTMEVKRSHDLKTLTVVSNGVIPVSSIYRGTIISLYHTVAEGITVIIQHPNDFISRYSGLTGSFVEKGDKVNAGTRIGIDENGRAPLGFELWHNGSALDPLDYIAF